MEAELRCSDRCGLRFWLRWLLGASDRGQNDAEGEGAYQVFSHDYHLRIGKGNRAIPLVACGVSSSGGRPTGRQYGGGARVGHR